jgi:hypothetical protein
VEARKALDLRATRASRCTRLGGPAGLDGRRQARGRAEEIADPETIEAVVAGHAPPGPLHLFRLDLREVSTVGLAEGRSRS